MTVPLPVMCLEQEILIVKHVPALVVDDGQICRAEKDQVDGLEGADHHLVHRARDQDQEHAVGEVLERFVFIRETNSIS